ncbi:MAG: helix-turn-helix domain-containing protein [Patescibacteria group bacterium]
MQFDRLLSQLGFSQNESKVYLAALESGLASAQNIAQKAGLQRTTTYSVLSALVSRGVVAKTKVKGKSRFLAESPDKLLYLLSELQAKLKKALPQLEAVYNKSEIKPKILFYEGDYAIQKVYDDTLAERPPEILEWNTNAYFANPYVDKDYVYLGKRVALNIHAKRIAEKGSFWETRHKKKDEAELSQTIIVPKEMLSSQIEVNIYNNKIAFMNYAESMSVIIESKAIAQAMKQIYELSWRGAKTMEIK